MRSSVSEREPLLSVARGSIQIRIGLNSGEVVVGAIGSDLRMDYTAVGQTTHLAARMEQMATPGTTLLAPATLLLAEGYVEVASKGPVTVKGMPDPMEVYELRGATDMPRAFTAHRDVCFLAAHLVRRMSLRASRQHVESGAVANFSQHAGILGIDAVDGWRLCTR